LELLLILDYYNGRFQKREQKSLNFLRFQIRRFYMANELTCPICEADIPLDGDEKTGDLILCSYCKVTFKMVKTKDKWILEESFEE
jgi:hypothetical protein